jgi:hypothetical protein
VAALGRRVEFGTFADLERLPEEPPWAWSGLLPLGSLAMLWGEAKKGKSTLLAGAVGAIETGGPFLGRSTSKATAVWLSEEPTSALRQKAAKFGLFTLASSISGSDRLFGVDWQSLIEQATRFALDNGHEILIVDTFIGLAGLGPEQENDAGAISEKLRPLRVASGKSLAVVFVHHSNKHGHKRPRGSGAFEGLVDVSIEFRRYGKAGEFRLKAEGRYDPLVVHGARTEIEGKWIYEPRETRTVGSESRSPSTDALLWDALFQAGTYGITYDEIDAIPGLSRDKAKKRFPGWFEEKKIDHHGDGKKGDKLRWFVVEPGIRCGAEGLI